MQKLLFKVLRPFIKRSIVNYISNPRRIDELTNKLNIKIDIPYLSEEQERDIISRVLKGTSQSVKGFIECL